MVAAHSSVDIASSLCAALEAEWRVWANREWAEDWINKTQEGKNSQKVLQKVSVHTGTLTSIL
jgi:HPt (histidine-containing phosphotransfer) domain-containing protein